MISTLHITILLCSLWTACSSPQQDDSNDLEAEVLASPDLSRLPANLRRRLSEGEERINVLKAQQTKLQSQTRQLEMLATNIKVILKVLQH